MNGDVPCELVAAHIDSLAAAAAPSALPEASQLEFASAFAEASSVTGCEALSQAERSCQLRAESLAAVQACVPRQPKDSSLARVVETENGLTGPTAAPPLPLAASPNPAVPPVQ